MAGIDVKVTMRGLREAKAGMLVLRKGITQFIGLQIYTYAQGFLLERIKVNTPILTGALRESLYVRGPSVRGTSRATVRIGSDKIYSLRVHEETFNLGPISRQQPGQPEGGVGNKYITRVVTYHREDMRKLLGARVKQEIRKLYASGAVRGLRR